MFLRLDDIPADGLELTIPLPSGALAPEGVAPSGPVTGAFRLSRSGSRVAVAGRVTGSFTGVCSRCLGEASARVDEEVSVQFRPASVAEGEPSEPAGRERELTGGELDVEFYEGDGIDMGEFLAEQVRLALPMRLLCSPSCAGLCPACGKPKTDGCSCAEKAVDDRWDALRGLLKR